MIALGALLAGLKARVVGALVAVAAVVALLAAIYRSGAKTATAKAALEKAESTVHQAGVRSDVDVEIARVPDPLDELRAKWRRPS